MKEYVVIYEWAGTNYSAYVPDLLGCVACGDTLAETKELIEEAINLYLEVLKEDGQPIPEATTQTGKVLVST
jgi:predicted RNase H-like HicB family nuclease